ncbi:rod shape-determining protein MreD [Motiliproteus sp. SC1-56]|uniref:rod shape-determining protein MreD n=1 Tax=Motiliproteus sp. SC1-56 TaxID=2799565 RepID=UPI001A8C16B8|nr:rod shape-determining protein MreD [Motiliproteus sp. SC1-56]
MVTPPARGGWVILLSFLFALMLSALPMPELFVWARPEWVGLTLIYWALALPHRVGPWYGWVIGLLLDILQGSLLGIHAFSLALMAFIVIKLHRRMRMFPLPQQALLVLVLVGIHQILLQWAQELAGTGSDSLAFLLPALVSAVLWPWVFVVLRGLRRALGVR